MKPYRQKILFMTILFVMTGLTALSGANLYVDTLPAEAGSGWDGVNGHTYDGGPGTGIGYSSIQSAVNAVTAGDTIYMRGGTYYEHINIPANKQGTETSPIGMRSYPGEWAKIDGQHNQSAAVITFSDGPHSICPMYWAFSNFEVTGGGSSIGASPGGGIMLDTAAYCVFKYLYVHDNYGGGSTNDGGIVIKNDTQAPQYITIKYCYIRDNGDPSNWNTGNISLFADYMGTPGSVNIDNARQHNEIGYNLLIGGAKGIKSKAEQYLSLDNSGNHTAYQDRGDKIHHNIVKDFSLIGIELRQDFGQVYNNIVNKGSGSGKKAITVGSGEANTEREPFHFLCYNNTVMDSCLGIYHFTNDIYGQPLNPHCHFYNNIIENYTYSSEL